MPATTPNSVFSTERWSPSDDPNMQWDFPAANGLPLEVRLYFANGYAGTASPGQRVFDVNIEGNTVRSTNYDIVADVGDSVGTMKAFDITSDGNVDIDFSHVVENPLITAIEIVRTDVPPGGGGGDDQVFRRGMTSGGSTGATSVPNGGQDWSSQPWLLHGRRPAVQRLEQRHA